MANLKINDVLTTPSVSPSPRPEPIQKPSVSTENTDTSKVSEASENIKAEEYGPIIATSSDGDTVRVKSSNESDESKLYSAATGITENDTNAQEIPDIELPPPPKPAFEPNTDFEPEPDPDLEPNPNLESATKNNESIIQDSGKSSSDSSQVSSYGSYTESQLKQMYLEGDISQIAYNLEIQAREAAKEEQAKETQEFTNDMADNSAEQNEIAQTAANIDTIENGDTSDTIPVDVRMQAMQTIENLFQ